MLTQDGQRERTRRLHCDSLSDRRRAEPGTVTLQRAIGPGKALGFDAKELKRRSTRRKYSGDTGSEPTSADRDNKHVRLRRIGKEFEGERALSRHHRGIVIGMHERQSTLDGELLREALRFIEHGTLEDDLGTKDARRLDLRVRRRPRHYDGCGNPESPCVMSDRLSVISRAHADHASRALLCAEREQPRESTALLEGGGELLILEFQPDLCACKSRQRFRMHNGRVHDLPLDQPRRRLHVCERDRKFPHLHLLP